MKKKTVALVLSVPLVSGLLIELSRLFAWAWVDSVAALLTIATGMIIARRLFLPYANPRALRVTSSSTKERRRRSR
jgi:hypothetical protein